MNRINEYYSPCCRSCSIIEFSLPFAVKLCLTLDTFATQGHFIEGFVSLSLFLSLADDRSPVVMNCPDDITATYPLGAETAAANWIEPTATDDSGVAFIQSRSSYPGNALHLWTSRHEIIYAFSDATGNLAYCTFYITFEPGS